MNIETNIIKSQPHMIHNLRETKTGITRNQLIEHNVSGKLWNEKKELVEKEMKFLYGCIPTGISLLKRETKKTDINPDGLRIFVHCDWIKRNRFYDYKGVLKLGRIFKAINKQLEGKTKSNILKESVN
jgi:hypothetical protein